MFYCLCEAAQQAFSDPVERKTSAARSVVYKMARICTNGARRACSGCLYCESSRCDEAVRLNLAITLTRRSLQSSWRRARDPQRRPQPSFPCGLLASVLQPLASFSCHSERERRSSEFVVCVPLRALQTVPYRAHALRHHAQLHTSRLPASPERCSMQPVASVRAALDQPVSASATSRLRPKNAPKRPMTTILFTRPNIHRVDRSSAWLNLRGHTQKKRRDRDENTSLD